jgi:predicted membrane protein
MINKNNSSNKNFGIIFSIIFIVIGIYPLLFEKNVRLWPLIIANILIFVSFFFPRILAPFNKVWHLFGLIISKFMGPFTMGLVYWSTIFSTSVLVKIFKKNYLNLKSDLDLKTYWINVSAKKTNIKDQF